MGPSLIFAVPASAGGEVLQGWAVPSQSSSMPLPHSSLPGVIAPVHGPHAPNSDVPSQVWMPMAQAPLPTLPGSPG